MPLSRWKRCLVSAWWSFRGATMLWKGVSDVLYLTVWSWPSRQPEAGVDLRAKQDEKYLTIAALNCASLPPTQGEPITRHQTWQIPQACRHLVFLKSWPWRGRRLAWGFWGECYCPCVVASSSPLVYSHLSLFTLFLSPLVLFSWVGSVVLGDGSQIIAVMLLWHLRVSPRSGHSDRFSSFIKTGYHWRVPFSFISVSKGPLSCPSLLSLSTLCLAMNI